MHKPGFFICAVFLGLLVTANPQNASAGNRVVIYDDVATEVAPPPTTLTGVKSSDLWVTLADLTRATRFELKPQGVCREQLCFPLPKKRKAEFLGKEGAVTWFNLSEFARLVHQPVAFDAGQSSWYFGPRSEVQNGFQTSLQAPTFTLPDMNGKMHSLADFRGKKVVIVTWASW